MRGAGPSELTKVLVNNQIAFCRVRGLNAKAELEKRFLEHRISYFVRWKEPSFFQKLFGLEKTENRSCILCIHSDSVEEAKELCKGVADVDMLV